MAVHPNRPPLTSALSPRHGGADATRRAARAGEAQAALDEWLLTERLQLRALRHRCVAPQALPVPLPFPNLFSPALSRSGDAAAHMVSPPPPPRGRLSVASLPVLTRLQHSGASRCACLPPPSPPALFPCPFHFPQFLRLRRYSSGCGRSGQHTANVILPSLPYLRT